MITSYFSFSHSCIKHLLSDYFLFSRAVFCKGGTEQNKAWFLFSFFQEEVRASLEQMLEIKAFLIISDKVLERIVKQMF